MDMDGAKKIVCEGSLAYLNDTTVRPYKTYDTTEIDCPINAPAEADKLFLWFIDQHNAHVANRCERFRVGINAGISYGRLSRGTGSRPTTIKEMRDKLTKLCGGYFRVRYDDYGSLIDWLPSRGAVESTQAVTLGKNLLDLLTGSDGKDIFTAVVPVGKAGEGEHEHDVTIDDGEQDGIYVAVSPDYYILGDAIVDKAKAEHYGVIEKTVQYRDISDKKQLAEKAMAELAAARFDDAIEVSAFDLHYADKSIRPINFLERVSVESKPHGLSRMMLCVGRTIDICDPTHTKYKFGAIAATLTKDGTAAQDDADAQQRRVTALSASTRTIAEDTKKTTIKVAEVDDRAVKADAKAEEAKKTVVKVEEQVTTATKKADAAASKVEEVSIKAEKTAQAVTTVVSDVATVKVSAAEAKETADAAGQEAHDAKAQAATASAQAAAVDGKATEAKQAAASAAQAATQADETAKAAKQAVDKLGNAFSADADGAHVGSKDGVHSTVDSMGFSIKNGTKEIAAFSKNNIKLSNGDLLINSGFIQDISTSATQIASKSFDFESSDIELHRSKNFVVTVAEGEGTSKRRAEYSLDAANLMVSTANGDVLTKVDDLMKLLKFQPWKTLHDNGTCRVRYCLRGGFMYLDCYLAGTSTYTTPEELPKDLLPAIEGYYPMGTQSGNDAAKIWIGSADGGDGHIYLYNWSSGYATGLFTFIPKSFE